MAETKLFDAQVMPIEDRVKVREWSSDHQSLYGEIDLKVRFDLEKAMDAIEENWLKFDAPVRREFARRIATLDRLDAIHELCGDEEEEGRSFKFNKWQ